MKALVVYESMFGNTELVARAIGAGLGADAVVKVARAPTFVPDDVDVLVVGGPTHTRGMSRPKTRAQAVERGASDPGTADGVREWLGQLNVPRAIIGAAFDTRVAGPKLLTGAAAAGIKNHLSSAGLRVVGTQSFLVASAEQSGGRGVSDDELERARRFGQNLGTTARALVTEPARPAGCPPMRLGDGH
jgi:hypothetical protein